MWQRFTERARKVIFYAQEEAQRLGESQVSTEHLLLGLIRETDSVAARILDRLGVSPQRIRAEIERYAPRGDARLGQEMQLTARAKRVIDLAYDEARQLNNNYIGTEHLLLGLIREGDGLAARVLHKLGVDLGRARNEVRQIQDQPAEVVPAPEARPSLIHELGQDMNRLAFERKLGTAYERDAEIYTVLQILAKLNRRNPLLVGERGVGKTTIVHGVVNVLVYGEPPEPLKGVQVVALPPDVLMWQMASVSIAARFVNELHRIADRLILFIDDLESLFDLGSRTSPVEPLHALKQVLNIGGVRCIGVYNTGSPHDSERLAQLQSLFEKVPIGEPTPEAVIRMLHRRRHLLHQQSGLQITDEAIEKAVQLSMRYLPDRRLPDKAIDLLESAVARVSLRSTLLPPEYYQRLAEEGQPTRLRKEEQLHYLRQLLEQLQQAQPESQQMAQLLEEQKQRVRQLIQHLEAEQEPPTTLTPQHVAEQLHEWTGIPIEQLMADAP